MPVIDAWLAIAGDLGRRAFRDFESFDELAWGRCGKGACPGPAEAQIPTVRGMTVRMGN